MSKDILVNIIDLLDPRERLSIRLVSRTLHAAAGSSSLELRPEKRLRGQQLLQVCSTFGSATALDLSHFLFLGHAFSSDIDACLQALPCLKSFSLANATGLEVPSSISSLKALQRLNLSRFRMLAEPPRGVLSTFTGLLSTLTGLQSLDISHLPELGVLPSALSELTALTELNAARCEALHRIPEAIGGLLQLRELDLSGCDQLQGLPEALGALSSLTFLGLSGCARLPALPESLGGLALLGEPAA